MAGPSESGKKIAVYSLEGLLEETKHHDGSDLHLTAHMPPVLRVAGELEALENYIPLSPEDIKGLLYSILTSRQIEVLEKRFTVDLAIGFGGIGRFRVSAYFQKGCITCAFRRLADEVPLLNALGLPKSVHSLPDLQNGLVLVTGSTGSGKSTTLAAIIDSINSRYSRNIITVEDPVEYIHINRRSIINQRELHADVESFTDALRSALRADPDVIMVGEMRDLETIRTSLRAAETGHLVFSTLHSRDAVSSINRIIGVFPPEEQGQIRQQLSASLKAVISQQLVPGSDGKGRVLASEVMMVTAAISNLIRMGKLEHIFLAIETGAKLGMQTMEQSLESLVKNGRIDRRTAVARSRNPSHMTEKLGFK